MRVSGAAGTYSSHRAGASFLWADPDYERVDDKTRLSMLEVWRGIGDHALPTEEPVIPEELKDAFALLDEVYEAAGKQMDRLILGAQYLHGTKNSDVVNRVIKESLMQTTATNQHAVGDKVAAESARNADKQIRAREQAGQAPPKVSDAASPAFGGKHADRVVEMAETVGVGMVAVAAGQAVDPTGTAAAGSIASEAASVVKAVVVSKNAVALTNPMQKLVKDQAAARRKYS